MNISFLKKHTSLIILAIGIFSCTQIAVAQNTQDEVTAENQEDLNLDLDPKIPTEEQLAEERSLADQIAAEMARIQKERTEASQESETLLTMSDYANLDASLKAGYSLPTLRNISKLYFKYGYHTPDDRDAVDSFLMLNECDTYNRYRKDDIEWTEILNSFAGALPKFYPEFPRKYILSQVLYLDNYDANTELFSVHDKYKIEDQNAFLISATATDIVCGAYSASKIENMPNDVVFRTDTPVTVSNIEMPPEIAKIVIDLGKKRLRRQPQQFRNRPSLFFRTRPIYLYIYGDVFRKNDEDYRVKGRGKPYPQFHMTLERIEIYADKEKRALIYEKNFRKKRVIDTLEANLRATYQEKRDRLRQN